MTLSRRAQLSLGAGSAVLLGGILGLSWWWWRHRPGSGPVTRFRRARIALAATGVLVLAAGAVWRTVTAIQHVPACSPPGGAQGATRGGSLDVPLLAQKAATWPETGVGMLWAGASGAHVCWSLSADYYVAVHADNIAGARAMTVGDVVLTPGFSIGSEQLRTLAGHEARHRAQWAVWTVIGGPFAFPVLYTIDDFFFPGERNHFERQAGLETGGYSHSGTGPVLGPAQLTTLAALGAIIVVALLAARHRRAAARPHSQE